MLRGGVEAEEANLDGEVDDENRDRGTASAREGSGLGGSKLQDEDCALLIWSEKWKSWAEDASGAISE